MALPLTPVSAAREHKVERWTSPTHACARCAGCGWYVQVSRRQNARARTAKLDAQVRRHLEEGAA